MRFSLRLRPSTLHALTAGTLAILICAANLPLSATADLPVPPQVLDPQTPAEAWNVIRLSTGNVARLLREERLQEVPGQISLCSPALRTLARSVSVPEHRQRVDKQTALAFRSVNDVAQAGTADLPQVAKAAFARLQAALDELKPAFSQADIDAEIFSCPQHPEMLATRRDTPCRICGAPFRVRRIPYTELYVSSGELQSELRVESDVTLAAGAQTTLRAQLKTIAGQPLSAANLVPLHSAPVRLLLVDPTLTEFHMLTPAAVDPPGTFETDFTPATSGPYRVWAELAPEQTALPEYPATDLGGEFTVVDRSVHDFIDTLSASAGGLNFQLSFTGGTGGSPPLRQVSMMRIYVTGDSGQPVTRLEPFMNAFAQLTGIYEDGKTILRLHPVGGDILLESLRGGPWLLFKIYPPQAGFIRFFCQVRVDGRVITAPLGVHITR